MAVSYAQTSATWVCNQLYNVAEFVIQDVHIFTGKRGLFSTSYGLKIAYLSGVPGEQGPTHFSASDVSAVRDACLKGQTNFKGIDILLTSTWPQGVAQVVLIAMCILMRILN
jgi:hypothetical protein